MTPPPVSPRGDHIVDVSWTVHCGYHSDVDAGLFVFACGVPTPCRSACPCEIADRYLVVDATRAGLRWWQCADVLICPPQPGLSAALRATSTALTQLPGSTLAGAAYRGSSCVLRTRDGTVLAFRHPIGAALLAAWAHRNQRRGAAP
jgi:hypothetical protein